jgi:hypothetical protein
MAGEKAQRRFVYYLKMQDGRLLHAEGESVEEAARAAGVKLADVKRHMPVRAIPTEAEREATARRIAEMKARKAVQE